MVWVLWSQRPLNTHDQMCNAPKVNWFCFVFKDNRAASHGSWTEPLHPAGSLPCNGSSLFALTISFRKKFMLLPRMTCHNLTKYCLFFSFLRQVSSKSWLVSWSAIFISFWPSSIHKTLAANASSAHLRFCKFSLEVCARAEKWNYPSFISLWKCARGY